MLTIAELLKPLAMPRRSSARTISATSTSFFPRPTGSTSSLATSTTSTPKRSPNSRTTRSRRSSPTSQPSCSFHAVSSTPGRPKRTTPPRIPSTGGGQATHRRHRTAHQESGWRRSTTRFGGRLHRLHQAPTRVRHPVLRVDEYHPHASALPTPSRRVSGQAGRWQSPYHDTMIDHDKHVGQLLDLLDELGIAEDTIVIYSTDNGPHMNTWPDAGMTPFRSEKNTNWEGAFRIPELIRWPGKIEAGTVSNEIIQHHDWLPTFRRRRGRSRHRREAEAGATPSMTRPTRSTSMGTTCSPISPGRWKRAHGRVHLFLRRLRCSRDQIRQLEGRLSWSSARPELGPVGGAVHTAACAQAVQPPYRSLRASRRHLQHLLRLVHRPRLFLVFYGGFIADPVPRDLQGVSSPVRKPPPSPSMVPWKRLHAFLGGR